MPKRNTQIYYIVYTDKKKLMILLSFFTQRFINKY